MLRLQGIPGKRLQESAPERSQPGMEAKPSAPQACRHPRSVFREYQLSQEKVPLQPPQVCALAASKGCPHRCVAVSWKSCLDLIKEEN